jgi:hypothetical protein
MAGGISTQDKDALLKAISSPSPNYSGPIGEPSYPSGVLSSGAYAPWAGIGDFQPTPMFQMQGPQVSYSNPNTGWGKYMDDLKKAENDRAAEAIRVRNNNNNNNNNNNEGGEDNSDNMGNYGGDPIGDFLGSLFGGDDEGDVEAADAAAAGGLFGGGPGLGGDLDF